MDTVDREDSVKRIDTHTHPKITTMLAAEISARSVIEAIREGLTGYGTSSYTPLRVKTAKSLKNITKMLRRYSGGDTGPRRSQSLGVPASA